MAWVPQRLKLFASERLRPARDLLTRVPKLMGTTPLVVDVGCGTGDASRLLLERFPSSKLLLLDKSSEQLEVARADEALNSRAYVSFAQEEAETHFASAAAASGMMYDLVFSNASLHWCENLQNLLPLLLNRVRPAGALALQMPDMRAQPSHMLFREAAAELGLLDDFAIRMPSNEMTPASYADALLGARCSELDMWSTTYVHVLEGDNAVFNFVKNTFDGRHALSESLAGVPADAAAAFEELYRAKVAAAYPPNRKGVTLYPFTRFFLVARRPSVLEALGAQRSGK